MAEWEGQSKKTQKKRYLILAIFFGLLVPVNLLLSLIFPPIFIQFVICMIPMCLFSVVFFWAYWAGK